jgi:hypothetical protein
MKMIYSPTPQLLGLFVLIAMVSGLLLPCILIYAVLRFLKDLRRIAVALEAQTWPQQVKAYLHLREERPRSEPGEPGAALSQFGR